MAITVTQRGAVCTGTDSEVYDIPSVALTNGLVYIAFIYTSGVSGTAPSVSSVAVSSGSGTLTMVKQTTAGDAETWSGTVRRVECWRGICTASGTATMRATLDGLSINTSMQIYELDGVKTSGASGANAVVQAQCKTNGNNSTTTLTVPLEAFANSNNRPLAFAVHLANEATAHDSDGGYSELFDGAHDNPRGGVCVQWHSSSADTAPDFAWSSSSANGGIALELAMSEGNQVVTPPSATLTITGFAPTVTSTTPQPKLTNGPWLVGGSPGQIDLELGDEFYFVVTGPSANAPRLRITVPYS